MTLRSQNRKQLIYEVLSMVKCLSDNMIRNSFLIVFASIILSCGQLVAQDITLGTAMGLNIPSLIGGGSDNPTKAGNSFNFGADFGVYGEYKIVDSYSFSVGLDYSSQSGWYRLKYLLVPFLARQTWTLDYQTKFYVGAGPFVGFLLDYNRTINPYVLDRPNNFNVGVGAIAGISHRFGGQGSFFIEVGFDYGFVRLQKPITQMKRHMFIEMINVGYSFPLELRSHKKHYQKLPYKRWLNN